MISVNQPSEIYEHALGQVQAQFRQVESELSAMIYLEWLREVQHLINQAMADLQERMPSPD